MTIETRIDCSDWAVLDFDDLAEDVAQAVLSAHGIDPEQCEVAILGADDAVIAVLNGQYRGKPTATNVLSWPAQDLAADAPGEQPHAPVADAFGDIALGDIALAFETCAREAEAGGKSLRDHTTHLIVHGLLHLLGYDHIRDLDATLMERTEAEILGKMGLPDPYSEQ